MPNDIDQAGPAPQVSTGEAAPSSFREFLRGKGEEFDLRDRRRRRREWLGALERLIERIVGWLHQSDPDGLLDIDRYEVSRTEPRLGTYEAPALRIRLGAAEARLIPIGREVPLPSVRVESPVPPDFHGRVDLADAPVSPLRRYHLLLDVREDGEHWHIRDEHGRFSPLGREEFERILQDLLS